MAVRHEILPKHIPSNFQYEIQEVTETFITIRTNVKFLLKIRIMKYDEVSKINFNDTDRPMIIFIFYNPK